MLIIIGTYAKILYSLINRFRCFRRKGNNRIPSAIIEAKKATILLPYKTPSNTIILLIREEKQNSCDNNIDVTLYAICDRNQINYVWFSAKCIFLCTCGVVNIQNT